MATGQPPALPGERPFAYSAWSALPGQEAAGRLVVTRAMTRKPRWLRLSWIGAEHGRRFTERAYNALHRAVARSNPVCRGHQHYAASGSPGLGPQRAVRSACLRQQRCKEGNAIRLILQP
jgi:hypothetical protein